MRLRQLIVCVLALGGGPGCHILYQDRPVAVVVRDAETKVPITGAEVRISDPTAPHGRVVAGTTADYGTALVWVSPAAEIALTVEASAKGYLADEKDLPVETLKEVPPAGLFGGPVRMPATVVMELFAYPRPAVELVVPAGYRGVLKAEVRAGEDGPPGRRAFSYTVPANGVVQVAGPPVLRYALPSDFRASYADGTPLRPDAKDDEVGLRWLKCEGDDQVFVVGTKSEWDDLHKSMEKDAPRGHVSGGKGGGQPGRGGGRRGGRGGMGGGGMGGR